MKNSMVKVILPTALIILFSSCVEPETPALSVDLLLINARVIDGTGEVYDGATIAISGERIESIVRGTSSF